MFDGLEKVSEKGRTAPYEREPETRADVLPSNRLVSQAQKLFDFAGEISEPTKQGQAFRRICVKK